MPRELWWDNNGRISVTNDLPRGHKDDGAEIRDILIEASPSNPSLAGWDSRSLDLRKPASACRASARR